MLASVALQDSDFPLEKFWLSGWAGLAHPQVLGWPADFWVPSADNRHESWLVFAFGFTVSVLRALFTALFPRA